MALRGTLTHRKIRRLARKLKIPLAYAMGVCETLWHVTAQRAPDGAIGRLSDEDIAIEMFWELDITGLIFELLEARLLDPHPVHRLLVHDWHIHADDATHAKLARARQRFAHAGEAPKISKLNKPEQEAAKAFYALSTGRQTVLPLVPEAVDEAPEPPARSLESLAAACGPPAVPRRRPSSTTPVPEPEPVPVPEPVPPQRESQAESGVGPVGPQPVESRPGDVGWPMALGIAAQDAARTLGITRDGAVTALRKALEARVRSGVQTLTAATETAVSHWRLYGEDSHLLVGARWGPELFFGDGWCWKPEAWPYDRRAVAEQRRARVGAS